MAYPPFPSFVEVTTSGYASYRTGSGSSGTIVFGAPAPSGLGNAEVMVSVTTGEAEHPLKQSVRVFSRIKVDPETDAGHQSLSVSSLMSRKFDWSRFGTVKRRRPARLVSCDRPTDRRIRCYPKLRLCRISKDSACRNCGAGASLILSYLYLSPLTSALTICALFGILCGAEHGPKVIDAQGNTNVVQPYVRAFSYSVREVGIGV